MASRYQKAFQDGWGKHKYKRKSESQCEDDDKCTLNSSVSILCLVCNCSLFVEVPECEKQQIQQTSNSELQHELFSLRAQFFLLTHSLLCVFLGEKLPGKNVQVMQKQSRGRENLNSERDAWFKLQPTPTTLILIGDRSCSALGVSCRQVS